MKTILTTIAAIVLFSGCTKVEERPHTLEAITDGQSISIYRLEYEGKVYIINYHGGIIEHNTNR